MTIVEAYTLYAGGPIPCIQCTRHELFGKFVQTKKPRFTSVPDVKASVVKARLTRYASETGHSIVHIERLDGKKSWALLFQSLPAGLKELERKEGNARQVSSYLSSRFGVLSRS